jgi:hypothetical protein
MGDNIPPRTFVTDGPALCIGDSGGPAFSMASTAIIGVWSQVVGECNDPTARNYFTEIAPFEDELITPAFAEAGTVPWLEGTTGPGGEPIGGTPGTGGDGGAPTAEGGAPSAEGGASTTGGTGESGGALASGGTSSGGRSASGGLAAGGSAGANGGLRKKGGCQCTLPGSSAPGENAWLGAPLFALGLLLRRARNRRSV